MVSISTPANAAVDAWLTKTEWLWFPPGPNFVKSCVSREIDIAAGDYRWQLGNSLHGWDSPFRRRDIYLAAGTYVWRDCIRQDSTPPYYSSYIHDSILQKKSNGSQATMWYRWSANPGDGPWKTTWGSYLHPI
jgi:hypothetical protein